MKKFLVLFITCIGLFFSWAQTEQDYYNYIKSATNLNVKSLIYNTLDLSPELTEKFDPVLNKYLAKIGKVVQDRAELFSDFMNSGDNLSDDQLNTLNKQILKSELIAAKIDKQFYNPFVKAIGTQKTTEFFLLKKYIDATLEVTELKPITMQ